MKKFGWFLLVITFLATTHGLYAQSTAFTYQGRLNDGGAPANGNYDFRFKLATDALGNNAATGFVLTNGVPVTNGLFVVAIDFGASVFKGSNLWLDVEVRTNNPANTLNYVALTPLQAITPTPYAITAGSVTPGAGLAGTYGGAVTLSNATNSITGTFTGNGAGVTNVNAATLNGLSGANFWQLGGNNVASGQVFGSTNNQPLQFLVNNQQVMQLAYASNAAGVSPNIIAGSSANLVSNGVVGATIIGGGGFSSGYSNMISADFSTVLGGRGNAASGQGAIAGGLNTTASGTGSVALGGGAASGDFSVAVGGGFADGRQSVALGDAQAEGNYSLASGASFARGDYSTAMGSSSADGLNATATGASSAAGAYSFAGGNEAQALFDGCFVWADYSSGFINPFPATATNQFLIRATGGVGIGTNNPAAQLHVASATTGTPQMLLTQQTTTDTARLRMNVSGSPFWEMDVGSGSTPTLSFWNVSRRILVDYTGNVSATSFNPSSDRNLKENFMAVSPQEVLDKVTALAITKWNFKEETVPHIGPMAQDFYAAFAVGMDDKHIATVDESGVALAAIQGLNQKLENEAKEKDAEIENLKRQNDALAGRLNGLEAAVKKLAAQK